MLFFWLEITKISGETYPVQLVRPGKLVNWERIRIARLLKQQILKK
jgi:hypothetical protein